jgi:hypothetical protein
MATKKQINQAAKAGQITKNEQKLLIAAVDRAAKTNSSISASETARLNQALEQAKTSAIAKGGVTAKQLLGTAASRQEEFGITPGGGQPGQRTEVRRTNNEDGSVTIYYSDGSNETIGRREQAGLTSEQTDWIAYLEQYMTNIGLPTLAPSMKSYIEKGYSTDTVILKIQETPEYKERFAGNLARQKAGLGVLDPRTYLALESDYRQIMRASGLPSGFYDDPTDFANFIGNDVSPAELKQRVDVAALSIDSADPLYKQSLQNLYGLSVGDMMAYALDPQRALPLIQRQAMATQFAAEGLRQGVKNVGVTLAEQYAGLGVTQEQARQGFEQVAQITPEAERLSSVFAGQEEAVGQEDVMSAVFTGDQSAQYKKRIQRLSEMEQSLFAGQSGVGRGSLGKAQTGQF